MEPPVEHPWCRLLQNGNRCNLGALSWAVMAFWWLSRITEALIRSDSVAHLSHMRELTA